MIESCQNDNESNNIRVEDDSEDETPIKEELSVFNQTSANSITKMNETPCFNKPSMRIFGNNSSMLSNLENAKGTSSFEDYQNMLEESADTDTTSFRQHLK